MRIVLLAILPLAAMATLSTVQAANQRPRAWKLHKSQTQPRLYDDRDRFGWYPRVADQLKVGSQIWFEQMEREGRFGGARRGSR